MVSPIQYLAVVLAAWGSFGSSFFVPQPLFAERFKVPTLAPVAGVGSASPCARRLDSSRFRCLQPSRLLRMTELASETVADEFQIKKDLLSQIDLATSAQKRTKVNELLLKLEPMNPTASPATSPVVNGAWEFLYTGGLSAGTLAVQILSRVAQTFSSVVDLKEITLTIKRDQPRVEAAITAVVLGRVVEVKVRTRLEQGSDVRFEEIYVEAEIAGRKVPIPERLQMKRTLFITYLDNDIMIARDDTGAPDLLIRKEKEFRSNDGVPSFTEEDAAPGSG